MDKKEILTFFIIIIKKNNKTHSRRPSNLETKTLVSQTTFEIQFINLDRKGIKKEITPLKFHLQIHRECF